MLCNSAQNRPLTPEVIGVDRTDPAAEQTPAEQVLITSFDWDIQERVREWNASQMEQRTDMNNTVLLISNPEADIASLG